MRRLPFLLAPAVLAAGALVEGQPAEPEYSIKAKMLVEMLSYVQWPPSAEPAAAFDLVVMGRSPFGRHLDDYARSRTIARRPIRIRYLPKTGDPGPCDAIFLCASESARADAVWAWAQERQALTLADDEALARRGAMVVLLMEGRFVRPAVNLGAASAAGISFSSRLLQYARILSTPRPSRRPAP
ncbi:YfiR family protein [Geothrix sp. 21YS21S-4]|uniref:YfiR family protein n=1 Tax=Geothrix sp. 21YS21S-4 TaxID=3068889 RepID=UPI0027BAA041|nr:YfiR family protein [Geothrix sp. 21YS21S-4]